jgi:phage-related minor tail protein
MSSDERPVIIKPTMDATGVRAGAEEVKKATRDMAQAVTAEGRKAGEGLDAIPEGAKRGAAAVDAETRRMTASIQRATAAAQAGGRQNAEYFEAIAAQRNLNGDVLKPYIASLRAAEQAQIAASGSLGKIGVSAGQTANALRQVPAQFTDIVTSLQAGQAPLQVFLQQGGQLKDSFGGAGAAAQALGGYVLGLINPYTVLAAVIGTVAVGYSIGSKEAKEYQRALVLSGNAVGVTADQLADLARAIAAVGPVTQGKAAEVLTQLAEAGAVGAANLGRFAEAAINLERVGGPAAEETAKAFAQLAKDPLQASIRLTESTRFLTAATAQQIAELERQGKTTEAARVAQEAYASALEGRIPDLAARLGYLERAWLAVKDATKQAGDAVFNIGRGDTLREQLAAVRQQLAEAARFRAADAVPTGIPGLAFQNSESAAKERLASLLAQVRASEAAAAAEGARVRQEEAGVKWLKDGEKLLSSQAKFAADVARTREEGVQAGKTEEEIAKRLVALTQQAYGGKGDNESQLQRERKRALEQQRNLLNELSGLTTSYAGDIQKLNAARAAGLVSEERYGELVRELVARQPFAKAAAEEQAKALKAETDATIKAGTAREQYLQTLGRDVQTGERTLEQLREEYIALTAGKEAVRERVALRIEEQIVALEMQAISEADRNLDFAAAEALRERIRQLRVEQALRRGLGAAQTQQDARQDAERAAQQAVKEWERASDQIGQSLSDALMQGGKSAGEHLASYFRTLVLRPIVEAVVRPLVGALGSALGTSAFAGPGGAGGGGTGGLGFGGLNIFGAAGSAFSAGAQISIAGGMAGTGTALQGAGSLIANGEVGAGLAQGAGSLAPYLAAYTIGKFAGQKISNGYAVGGGSGNAAINVGSVIGAIVGGPIGAGIGAAIGGLVNRAFGRKLVDSGIEGTFAGGGFTGNAFQFQKGGFFRSNKTTTSALDSGVADLLSTGAQAVAEQARVYAELLGLPAEAIAGYSRSIKVSLKDLSAEQIGKAIEGEIAAFGEGLAGQFNAQLAPFVKAGEKLSETFTRLAGLQAFSVQLNSLGGVFSRLANLSVGAREGLLEMAGGPDALAGLSQSFAQTYYGRDEIAALKARDLQSAFAAAGVTNAPNSREQFRALVEGVDVSSTGGQQQLIDLLKLGGDFATVADYLAETGKTLSGAAASAPLSTQLASLFSQPQQQQVDAINNVAVGVGAVEAAVDRLTEVVRSGGYRGYEEPNWRLERPGD